ncbi:MAG: hypothetical protein HQL69_09990 [Magnetococcales bacterium]|nr:hypothetical protein [Magnetococcales bacterium]
MSRTLVMLGLLFRSKGDLLASASWLIKGVRGYAFNNDARWAEYATGEFIRNLKLASQTEQETMLAEWSRAGLDEVASREVLLEVMEKIDDGGEGE